MNCEGSYTGKIKGNDNMTKVKCPHCGGYVEIPREIDEAAQKYNARKEDQRKLLKDKRAEDPTYGKPEIYKIMGGSIMQAGQRLVLADDIHIERLKSGSWRGWANLDWRSLMRDPSMTLKLQGNYPVDGIELGDGGPVSRIVMTLFLDNPRRPRLEFVGVGDLNLPEGSGQR